MRTSLLLVGVAGLSALLAGCDNTPEAPRQLATGTRTFYDFSLRAERDGAPDSLLESSTIVQSVVAEDQTVQGEEGLTEVIVREEPAGRLAETRMWYRLSDERLEEVAYRMAPGPTPPLKRTAPVDPTLPRRLAERLAALQAHAGPGADSVIVRTHPRIVAEYPLTEGRSWVHFDLDPEYGFDLRSTRTVLGSRTVETPEGRRTCQRVETVQFLFGEREDNFDWEDCFDADGLVLREVTYRDAVVEEGGEPVVVRERLVRRRIER